MRLIRPILFASLSLAAATLVSAPRRALAQAAPATTPDSAQLQAFVRAHAAVTQIRDRIQAQMAEPRNKKIEEQTTLREKLKTSIADALKAEKLTAAEFDRLTKLVATDDAVRKAFDTALADLAARKPPTGS